MTTFRLGATFGATGGLKRKLQNMKAKGKKKNTLPYKFLQGVISDTVCALPIFSLKHRTIHTSLEECPGRRVGGSGDELEELVDVTVEIAPCKGGLGVGCCARTEVEFFRDEKDFFFVGCIEIGVGLVGKGRTYFRLRLLGNPDHRLRRLL